MNDSNFAFLHTEWPTLHESAAKAEALANGDARAACFYARWTLELAVNWLYRSDRALKLPYQDHLSARLHEPSFKAATGNADASVHGLSHLTFWLAPTYACGVR